MCEDVIGILCRLFFFSSRRRHTRFDCDWSSDVCSSDLSLSAALPSRSLTRRTNPPDPEATSARKVASRTRRWKGLLTIPRSEERRVGKECRSRWLRYDLKKKSK